jgi:hypothetical protein
VVAIDEVATFLPELGLPAGSPFFCNHVTSGLHPKLDWFLTDLTLFAFNKRKDAGKKLVSVIIAGQQPKRSNNSSDTKVVLVVSRNPVIMP